MSLLSVKNVNFKDIIDYPDMEFERGTVNFITGKSGCGKSTLLRLLNNVVSPEEGEILYNGKNIKDSDTVKLRQNVSLCGQTVYLFDKSIKENFAEFYGYRDLPVPDDETIKKYLEICCLDFDIDADCTKMSGGEKQRVYLAVFISFLPDVLMLDEPTSALDEATSFNVFKNLANFCNQNSITLIAVTHNSTLASRFGDKIINLEGKP